MQRTFSLGSVQTSLLPVQVLLVLFPIQFGKSRKVAVASWLLWAYAVA